MTNRKDVVLEQLRLGEYLIEKFTADLSDPEYFMVPAEGANHAGWILGHIAVSEDAITSAATGSPKRLPEPTHELFKGGTECRPDASKYPTRSKIDELFRNARVHTVEALKGFDEGRWDDPSPDEYSEEIFPTLGSLWAVQGTHQYWHIGQLTVCRTALKKGRVLAM